MRAWDMALGVPSLASAIYVPKNECHCETSKRYWARQDAAKEFLKYVEDHGYTPATPVGKPSDAGAFSAAKAAVARLRLAGLIS